LQKEQANNFSVSFVVVVRNAAPHLPDLVADLQAQNFPRHELEILIVDGVSNDNSAQIASNLLENAGFQYQVLNNPEFILSTGWNIALAAASNDIILRVDAHSRFEPDFISNNVRAHQKGEFITGGPILSVASEGSGGIILAVEQSRFGAGTAGFRNDRLEPTYVDTIGYGAYRREVFAKVGGYNKFLVRNQDNEIHFRMLKAGYRFYFDPSIRSNHFVRPHPGAFFKQKFRIGYWIALTAAIEPRCFAPRHLIPFVFLMAILLGTGILFSTGSTIALLLSVVPYSVLAVFFSIKETMSLQPRRAWMALAMPFLFLLTHLTYGLGTLTGIFRIPYFLVSARNYKIPFPIKPDNNNVDEETNG